MRTRVAHAHIRRDRGTVYLQRFPNQNQNYKCLSVFFFPCTPSATHLALMVRRHISDDLKEMALAMSLQGLPDSEVRELTGISERSLKRLRRTYRDKGKVSNGPSNEGRPRILSAMEVKVRRNFSGLVYLLIIGSFSVTVSTVSLTRPSSSCKLSSVRSSLSRCLCRRLRGPSSGRVIL